MMISPLWIIIFFSTITPFSGPVYINAQQPAPYNPTAQPFSSWINTVSANGSVDFTDTSTIRPILVRESIFGPNYAYACGFYCNGDCRSYLFATFIVQTRTGVIASTSGDMNPLVVWSANRNNPVRVNAALEFTDEGDLVLRDADGKLAWSTYTAGRSVAGLNLTEMGNLVMVDANGSVVWQSFDHPTDCLVPGQMLLSGKNLTASTSSTNWSSEGGLFSVSMTDRGFVASITSDPPQVYYTTFFDGTKPNKEASYAKYRNGSLEFYLSGVEPLNPDVSVAIPLATSVQYMRLGPDGHLRVFELGSTWKEVGDILTGYLGLCNYPMVCGKYGICSNGQCSCPNGTRFRQISDRRPDLGCSEEVPLTCNASDNHSFLDIDDVTYFNFAYEIRNTDRNSCKEACLKNCSCKAVIFQYGRNPSAGSCFLPSEIFSLMNNEKDLTYYNSSVSIKVQIDPNVAPPTLEKTPTAADGNSSLLGPILGSTLGVLCVAVFIGTIVVYRRRRKSEEIEEDYLDSVPGMPTRFSFEELATATDNFNKKLGEGGFGSVYEGSLNDGTRIAVKRLDGVGHIKKSFLAEVESIGNIHHINLVRLIGFCAEKSHRLLVYEYMCNGSLDRWIYCGSQKPTLDWDHRRKIVLDIAKGLAYLHEDCRHKIIHLDVKPQNILLDKHYNAKLADFGLSKLIDRDQSKVVTTMRGTPGYLAPEWLRAVITEKVDVYSFGVVILEIVCGRKIFEESRAEEERHLPTIFMRKAEEGQWLELVDRCCLDVESNVAQVKEMMQISAWCLQSDYAKRPCMSMVIKTLEGVKDIQKDIDYNFLVPQYLISKIQEGTSQEATALLPSVLSGPR